MGLPAVEDRRQLAGQERRHRDSTGLVRLGRTEDDMAADVGEGPVHIDPAAAEVDVASAHGSGLALRSPV